MNNKPLIISYSFLRRCAIYYITLPLFCFFVGWLRWYWAGLASLTLFICILLLDENSKLKKLFFKKKANEEIHVAADLQEKTFSISKTTILIIVLISFIYLLFCGIGRLWAQSDDCIWRNAIFRDLILRDWPVFYDKFDGALCYYISVWLPAAIIGKISYALGRNAVLAFSVGNFALLLYFTLGLSILFLLLLFFFQTTKTKNVILIMIGLIFFSGMDFAGSGYKINENYLHLEWWAGTFQYSSLTTCLCWVFNQALIPWICTTLLLHENTVKNYVLIGMACLFSGPFPFIGFFVYCVAIGIKRFVEMLKSKKVIAFGKEVFSISNICSTLVIFPIIGSYLTSNSLMGAGINTSEHTFFLLPAWAIEHYILYLYFMLIEFGIFAIIIAKFNKGNFIFYITIIQLVVYPWFNYGINSDLTMRASIPAIFMMYILCYQYILNNPIIVPIAKKSEEIKKNSIVSRVNIFCLTLSACLVIGAVTPGVEFYRAWNSVRLMGINDKRTDSIVTLNRDYNPLSFEEEWPPQNFTSLDPDNKLFFKVFAKTKDV